MTSSTDLCFYSDRMPVKELAGSLPESVMRAFRERQLGKLEERDRVHFCGLIVASDDQSAFFLPRGVSRELGHARRLAPLVMRSIARYVQRHPERQDAWGDELCDPTLQRVILDIFQDYTESGLFFLETSEIVRNGGKTDWDRTIRRTTPLLATTGAPVFLETRGKRRSSDFADLITSIHLHVLSEINRRHAWWLCGRSSFEIFRAQNVPPVRLSPDAMKRSLISSKRLLFSARSIRLINLLIEYLDQNGSSSRGFRAFGIESFHSVWEDIVCSIFTDNNQSARLQFPSLWFEHKQSGSINAPRFRLIPDLIIETESAVLVVDAKYYSGASAETMPGIADYIKQNAYSMAATSLFPGKHVSSHYVLPRASEGPQNIVSVNLRDASGGYLQGFDPVRTHFLGWDEALGLYLANRKRPFF